MFKKLNLNVDLYPSEIFSFFKISYNKFGVEPKEKFLYTGNLLFSRLVTKLLFASPYTIAYTSAKCFNPVNAIIPGLKILEISEKAWL